MDRPKKKIFGKNIFAEKKLKKTYFFRGRKPAQKDKRLYPNSSPRSGTKIERKKKQIFSTKFFGGQKSLVKHRVISKKYEKLIVF